MSGRFTVFYRLTGNEPEALAKARDICIEQTVEFPPAYIQDERIRDHIIGKLISLQTDGAGTWLAEISYAEECAGEELTQFLNVLFGNSSIKPGIRIERITLSKRLAEVFRGPRFGVAGIRGLLAVHERPLLCSAIKPMGMSAVALAELAAQFAAGGIDIIKDDHGLANQRFCPFRERVARVAEAVSEAARRNGGRTLYAPNITADGDETLARAHFAKRAGAGALVISPALCGFGAMWQIAMDDSIALPVLWHPAFAGAFTVHADSGISHGVLYGQLARIGGADAAIFPNFGGRFSFSRDDCAAIIDACSQDMLGLRPIFPAPGGGMTLDSIPQIARFYGRDVILLMGGGLFAAGPDLVENCRTFRRLALAQ